MMKKLISILPLAFVLASCTSMNNEEQLGPDGLPAYDTLLEGNSELVASNLIYALSQLPFALPVQTTVQINEPVTPLGKTVLDCLRDAGYGIQKVSSDQGRHYVRYKFEESITEKGPVVRYSMSIGSIVAERDFVINDGNIMPDSALFVKGVERVDIDSNDDIFNGVGSNYRDEVVFEDQPLPVLTVVDHQKTESDKLNKPVFKQNMYETRKSNFSGLFGEYDNVDTTILVFANDSMLLGASNKEVISKYVNRMNPDTDIISIIGCSHGKSNLKSGNSLLAVGRANRVKEAFVYAGVEYGKVFDEGCWAPVHFDEEMPRRGVVLSLKRLKG